MKGRPNPYSEAELAWIERTTREAWYATRAEQHEAFVFRFGREDVTFEAFKNLCQRHGWKTGQSGRFKSGQAPANKGKTMPYHPNSARTRFKKGQRPHTWRGPGHESIDNKDGYVWIIVAERNPYTGAATRRVQKHKWLWEKQNGPVPEGHVLKCLDGDKTNTDPLNWAAVPRALLPRLSGRWTVGYDQAPAELKPTILAVAKLEHAAREVRKGRKG